MSNMNTSNAAQIETLNAQRDAIARELDKALEYNAGTSFPVSRLKCSPWYRDRSALIRAIDQRIAILSR